MLCLGALRRNALMPGDFKRELIAHLGTLDFVTAKEKVLPLGPPGSGKTPLATGLAIRACQAGHRVLFAMATCTRPQAGETVDPMCTRSCARRPIGIGTEGACQFDA